MNILCHDTSDLLVNPTTLPSQCCSKSQCQPVKMTLKVIVMWMIMLTLTFVYSRMFLLGL